VNKICNNGGDLQFYCHLKKSSVRGMGSIMERFSERKILTTISNYQLFIKGYPRESTDLNVVILFITNLKYYIKFRNSGSRKSRPFSLVKIG
jgi:hypothetical protein